MSTYPARDAFTLHRVACERCRTAQPPHGFCDAGQRLYLAMYPERPGVAPAVLAWSAAMVVLVTLCAVLWLVSVAADAAPPTLAAAGAVAPQGELVWVLAQTERAVQIGSSAESGPGEVADALGWPWLTIPAHVCVGFEGTPGITKKRTARLLDRSACQGATK